MRTLASPAMESPATTATATGRKTGSTSASAAAGYSAPSASTADRNALPWPGGGVRWVIVMKTATTKGSAQVKTTLIHGRGRRSSLTSSTPITTHLLSSTSSTGLCDPAYHEGPPISTEPRRVT